MLTWLCINSRQLQLFAVKEFDKSGAQAIKKSVTPTDVQWMAVSGNCTALDQTN